MVAFGSFSTEREVYSDPNCTVYTARRRGDPQSEYVVKVFRLRPGDEAAQLAGSSVQPDERARALVQSIELQAQASAVSQNIAPVFERGQDERTVWYATRLYAHSLAELISGKTALPRASLEHIVSCIAQGALDFRAFGRSHGDIRPGNIYLSKTVKLTEAQVVLCDPLPGGAKQARAYELSDLHAVGAILLQLVRQRILTKEEIGRMLPLALSREWVRVFGSHARAWLTLCDRLLHPNLSPERFNLEDLVNRLDELKRKRRRSRTVGLMVAGSVTILVATSLWLFPPGSGRVQVTSDPPGATVVVDRARRYGPTPITFRVRDGAHVLEARHDQLGLGAQTANAVVPRDGLSSVSFRFPYGTVALRSDPPGATVFHGDVAIGKIPSNGQPLVVNSVAPGLVSYHLKLEDHEPVAVVGIVTNGQRLELKGRLPVLMAQTAEVGTGSTNGTKAADSRKPGVLELSAAPLPALVLDSAGRELGTASSNSPLTLSLAAGSYSFVARSQGLGEASLTVAIESGKTNRGAFSFEYGTVDWTSETPDATVSVGTMARAMPTTFFQRPGVATSYVISAPGYRTETRQVLVANGEGERMHVNLIPEMIGLEIQSDPPGAQILTPTGRSLAPSQTNRNIYYVPPGPIELVARLPALGTITNFFVPEPEQNLSQVRFKFDYGTLVLTNLPPDVSLYEGGRKIGSTSDKWVYQRRGPHRYALHRSEGVASVSTNIHEGLNFLSASAEKSWKNSLGMWFAWVPNLPGGGVWPGQSEPGGWVALTEVTQGQYKRMDGSNPSAYRGGDNYPVENLTWQQAQNFCSWLTAADTAEHLGWHYALPTDEQFSAFAADAERLPRVTNEGRMSASTAELFPAPQAPRIPAAANFGGNARTHPEPVASTRQANVYGLYDVVGNVWEWLAGWNSRDKAYAGGSYLNFSQRTLADKAREHALEKGPNIGFRVVLVPPR